MTLRCVSPTIPRAVSQAKPMWTRSKVVSTPSARCALCEGFFAAARTIVGPPTSMFSTASSKPQPGRAMTPRKTSPPDRQSPRGGPGPQFVTHPERQQWRARRRNEPTGAAARPLAPATNPLLVGPRPSGAPSGGGKWGGGTGSAAAGGARPGAGLRRLMAASVAQAPWSKGTNVGAGRSSRSARSPACSPAPTRLQNMLAK